MASYCQRDPLLHATLGRRLETLSFGKTQKNLMGFDSKSSGWFLVMKRSIRYGSAPDVRHETHSNARSQLSLLQPHPKIWVSQYLVWWRCHLLTNGVIQHSVTGYTHAQVGSLQPMRSKFWFAKSFRIMTLLYSRGAGDLQTHMTTPWSSRIGPQR